MNKDKIIKDLKERNDKLANQYRLRDIRCVHLEMTNEKLQQENKQLKEKIENLTTMTVCGDRKQIKNTAQYKLELSEQENKQLKEENNQLKSILTELEEWIKEENTYSDYKDITYRETMGYVLDKITELKEKYK